jgi:hypothetical protein
MRNELAERINSDANRTLRLEVFRLARNRDIFGVTLIASALLNIALSILLIRHW